jgi:hypothetical protein
MESRRSVLKLGVCCLLESFFNSATPICQMRVKGKNSGPPLSQVSGPLQVFKSQG